MSSTQSMPPTLIDCSKVSVIEVKGRGASAVAAVDISAGEIVERGIVRRLDIDGMKNEYVFTWSDEIPNKTWAFASGCATFYNTAKPEDSNTKMKRMFDSDTFVITATRDIKKGEELTHTYKSLKWRGCWDNLRNALKVEKQQV